MRQMLLIWGDYDFAEALARQPTEIRKAVSSNFRVQPQDKDFAILFHAPLASENKFGLSDKV
jgi:hypothetical protein